MIIHFCIRIMYTSSTRVNSSASSGASILPMDETLRMELLLFHGGMKRDEGNNPWRVLSSERLGKKQVYPLERRRSCKAIRKFPRCNKEHFEE